MEIVIVDGYRELSARAAVIVGDEIRKNRRPVLGLATGSTPEGMYAQLVKMFTDGEVDFSNVITFNLDEYAGLHPGHPQSYHYYMHRHLFDHINIKKENIHFPQCCNQDVGEFCREYDRSVIAAGGIDLQILGIGGNGHIGFNEPGRYLNCFTHLTDLTEDTIKDNSRFFNSADEVPRQAVTMGMGSIMHATKILLLASGNSKARAIKHTAGGTITTDFPASLLQLHRDVILLVDREAAALIEKR